MKAQYYGVYELCPLRAQNGFVVVILDRNKIEFARTIQFASVQDALADAKLIADAHSKRR